MHSTHYTNKKSCLSPSLWIMVMFFLFKGIFINLYTSSIIRFKILMNFIKYCDHCDALMPSSVLSVDSLQSAVLCHVHEKSNVLLAQLALLKWFDTVWAENSKVNLVAICHLDIPWISLPIEKFFQEAKIRSLILLEMR